MKIGVIINGTEREIRVHPLKRMIDVLREEFGLLGVKEGCGEGECGACAVLLNGRLVDSCLIPAMQMAGGTILTIEGLDEREELDTLQNAFLEAGAIHCGFCTPGMIMAAYALLTRIPHPSEEQIKIALSGNICRCTGYGKIVAAVRQAADAGYGDRLAEGIAPRDLEMKTPLFEGAEEDCFFSPTSLNEALTTLSSREGTLILCGGTDIGPATRGYKDQGGRVMDVFSLPELSGIDLIESVDEPYIRIGAAATNTDILESCVVHQLLPLLAEASSRSGALAIQNRATIGGNVVTASGAGDLPTALLALGASAVVVSKGGERVMPLENFITGYRQTALLPGELLKELRIPRPSKGSVQAFFKRGSRKSLTLARVSLAFLVLPERGRISCVSAAAGSMSPTPILLKGLMSELTDMEINDTLPLAAGRMAASDVNPRKSPRYRKAIVENLTRRFFTDLLKENKGGA